jgi:hypothetical protein
MYEDDSNKNYNEVSQSAKSQKNRERGGLIPVTATILKEAEVTKEETVEYQGVPISDITAIGYVVDYKEMEAKIKLTLFDFTGLIEINFFNKIDTQDSAGLSKFYYDGTKKAVQIFGTVKVFKNEKNIQGAKIINVPANNVLYHRADVIHAWLYLTGKLNDLKQNQVQNTAEEAKMIAMGKSSNNGIRNSPIKNQGEKDLKNAVNLLENYRRKNNTNEIENKAIYILFKNFGNKIKDVINNLINDNKLIETDNGYEIMV